MQSTWNFQLLLSDGIQTSEKGPTNNNNNNQHQLYVSLFGVYDVSRNCEIAISRAKSLNFQLKKWKKTVFLEG